MRVLVLDVLGNCVIDYVEKVKCLGFLLTCDLRDDIDMYRQLRYAYGTANRLRSKFSDCFKNVKNYLFHTFRCSFCGSKSVRLIGNLPFTVSG